MGLTQHSIDNIIRFDILHPYSTMLEFGCQNMYDFKNYNRIAKHYFQEHKISHISIDQNGKQESINRDLRSDVSDLGQFDIVTNYGTLEHLENNIYQGFKNIHDCTKINGYIIHELPKTGHWIKHGYAYFDQQFFIDFAEKVNYDIIFLSENGNMGNWKDGIVISVIYKKTQNNKFMSEAAFNKLKIYDK